MIASSFMTVLVPKVAGVARVVACAPPREGGGIHPATALRDAPRARMRSSASEACRRSRAGLRDRGARAGRHDRRRRQRVRRRGQAAAVRAVGIDLLAGPTEILVIADESADPRPRRADLLGQAEHGPTSPAVLITTSRARRRSSGKSTAARRGPGRRPTATSPAWRGHGFGRGRRAATSRRWSRSPTSSHPSTSRSRRRATSTGTFERLRTTARCSSAREATVAYGDKAIGTNHVLPTSGAARYTGGLWVGKFLKTVTYQRVTEEGTRRVAPAAAAISDAELFAGHALTARLRLDRLPQAG